LLFIVDSLRLLKGGHGLGVQAPKCLKPLYGLPSVNTLIAQKTKSYLTFQESSEGRSR
jgi:hypothetical protein